MDHDELKAKLEEIERLEEIYGFLGVSAYVADGVTLSLANSVDSVIDFLVSVVEAIGALGSAEFDAGVA